MNRFTLCTNATAYEFVTHIFVHLRFYASIWSTVILIINEIKRGGLILLKTELNKQQGWTGIKKQTRL